MIDRQAVAEARRMLGRRLAELRKAAGYSQHQLAPFTLYTRSTLANVEIGRQHAKAAEALHRQSQKSAEDREPQCRVVHVVILRIPIVLVAPAHVAEPETVRHHPS